ncbi:MAG: O-antigen ligase family protein [Candidatus Tectomicrobia bacterium]|nr:O-antigen ligase family protein [Candidatus Tectomicrobia bacterium]
MTSRFFDILIELGLIFLIIFAPLAFGSVHPWAYTIMELTAFTLVLLWFFKTRSNAPTPQPANPPTPSPINVSTSQRINFIKTPLNLPMVVLLVIILFQLIPFPPAVIKFLSPNTYELYKQTLPDYESDPTLHVGQGGLVKRYRSGYRLVTLGSWTLDLGHPSDYRTLSIYPHETKTELLKYLAYMAVFFIIVNTVQTRRQVNRLLWVMVLTGAFVAIYGVLQYITGETTIWGETRRIHTQAVNGTYINRNHFAGLMEMCIAAALGLTLALATQYEWARDRIDPLKRVILDIFDTPEIQKQIMLVFLMLVIGLSLFFSFSRGGILSLLFSLILLGGILSLRKSWTYALYFLALPITLFLVMIWVGIDPLADRFGEISEPLEDGRWQVNSATLSLIRDYSLFGAGLGNYKYLFARYQPTQFATVFVDHAHNDYLETSADNGLIAFSVIIIGLLSLLWVVLRNVGREENDYGRGIVLGLVTGIIAIATHSLFDFNLQIPANALYFTFLLSLAYVSAHLAEGRRGWQGMKMRLLTLRSWMIRGVVRLIVVGLYLFLVFLSMQHYLAERSFQGYLVLIKEAREQPRKGDKLFTEGLSALKRAIALNPANAKYPYELATLLETRLRTSKIESLPLHVRFPSSDQPISLETVTHLYQRAIDLNPVEANYHISTGWYELLKPVYEARTQEVVYSPQVSKAFEAALWLKPNFAYVNDQVGRYWLFVWKRFRLNVEQKVVETFKKALGDDPYPGDVVTILESVWNYGERYEFLQKIVPETPRARSILAQFLQSKGFIKEAEYELKKISAAVSQ